jgi:hypothetical protein
MILDEKYIKEQAHKPCFWSEEFGFDVVGFTHAMEQNFSSRVGNKINSLKKQIKTLEQQLAERDKQVTLLRDALTESRRELDSCQKVIWLASDYGFDPAYVKGAQASIRKTDEALASTDPK